MNNRIKKVNELIKQEVSKILEESFNLPEGELVTVTAVETTPDLRRAIVWISFLKDQNTNRILNELNKHKNKIQQILNKRLVMKYVPRISFKFDPSLIQMDRIEKLLDQIKTSKFK